MSGMFDQVAGRYDLTNTVLSLGQDQLWRIATTRAIAPARDERILDLAAGTGASAVALARSGADVLINGLGEPAANRKLADEALRKSESLYRSILETSPDVIAIVDLEGYVRMVSPIATKLYRGHSDNDLIGRNIFDIIAPHERQRAITNTNLMLDKYLGSVEYQILRFDGTIFDAEVNGNVIWSENNIPTGASFVRRSGECHDGMTFFGMTNSRFDVNQSDSGLLVMNHEYVDDKKILHPAVRVC